MKKVLYMHTGSANHGCEALVRTTAKLLGGPKDVVLWSFLKEEELRYGTDQLVEKVVRSEELPRASMAHVVATVRRILLRQPLARQDVFIRKMFKGNIAISIGGDNYCYPWSARQGAELNEKIRKVGAKTVFWGCSIDEESITEQVRRDLEQFDLITARECLSYEILKKINPNTVQVADPAFLLEKKELPLPEGFVEGNTVGINISPMVMDYGDGDIIMRNYEGLISYILKETNMNICLIPHVVWANNNDLEPLGLLYEKFKDSRRICMLEDHDCTELKGFISRCRFFAGARTHATIAAYSSHVPTLVVGYSIKSRGIALDLFGTEENYVLPVQKLQQNGELTRAFCWLQENEEYIRDHLQKTIPEYKKRALSARKYLDQL